MRGIVTLCGSVRFKDKFDEVNRNLTRWGYVVLQPGIWSHDFLHTKDGEYMKKVLDELHRDKIMMSDSIVIIDVDGYIGESTAREIRFAEKNEKVIYTLVDYGILENRGL